MDETRPLGQLPQLAVAQKHVPKWLGKWNQRLKPAVCPSCLILSHTQLASSGKLLWRIGHTSWQSCLSGSCPSCRGKEAPATCCRICLTILMEMAVNNHLKLECSPRLPSRLAPNQHTRQIGAPPKRPTPVDREPEPTLVPGTGFLWTTRDLVSGQSLGGFPFLPSPNQ